MLSRRSANPTTSCFIPFHFIRSIPIFILTFLFFISHTSFIHAQPLKPPPPSSSSSTTTHGNNHHRDQILLDPSFEMIGRGQTNEKLVFARERAWHPFVRGFSHTVHPRLFDRFAVQLSLVPFPRKTPSSSSSLSSSSTSSTASISSSKNLDEAAVSATEATHSVEEIDDRRIRASVPKISPLRADNAVGIFQHMSSESIPRDLHQTGMTVSLWTLVELDPFEEEEQFATKNRQLNPSPGTDKSFHGTDQPHPVVAWVVVDAEYTDGSFGHAVAALPITNEKPSASTRAQQGWEAAAGRFADYGEEWNHRCATAHFPKPVASLTAFVYHAPRPRSVESSSSSSSSSKNLGSASTLVGIPSLFAKDANKGIWIDQLAILSSSNSSLFSTHCEESAPTEPRFYGNPVYSVEMAILSAIGSTLAHEITLVTHFAPHQFHLLERLLSHWQGPVSAALFVSHEEGQRDGFVEEILAQQVDIDTIRRRVDLHLVWPRSPPTKGDTVVPTNFLRNVALRGSRTKIVLSLDLDFIPSPNLYQNLHRAANDLNGMEGEFAIVIPSFELLSPESNTKDEIPMDTDSLLQMIDDLRAYPVFTTKARARHVRIGTRDTERRFETAMLRRWRGNMEQEDWETEIAETQEETLESNTPANLFRLPFKHLYRPFLLTTKDTRFDERFEGGEHDVRSRVTTLGIRGCRFYMLEDAFVTRPSSATHHEREHKYDENDDAEESRTLFGWRQWFHFIASQIEDSRRRNEQRQQQQSITDSEQNGLDDLRRFYEGPVRLAERPSGLLAIIRGIMEEEPVFALIFVASLLLTSALVVGQQMRQAQGNGAGHRRWRLPGPKGE